MKLQLRQWHVFTLLWIQVLSYPLVASYLEGKGIQWEEVVEDWLRFVPFFLLFLLHNFVAIPCFLLPRRITGYILAVILLLCLFMGGQYAQFSREAVPPQRMMRERLSVERPHRPAEHSGVYRECDGRDFPPPPPPGGKPDDGGRPDDGVRRGNPHFLIMDFVFAVLMLGCNITVVLLFQIKKTREKADRLERINMLHELKYLKAQFSPHFLMNTLNNIHAMIEVNPAQAQDMVISLSKLLRYALYDGAAHAVPLSLELAFISNYVHLRSRGYSEKKLSVNLSLPADVPDNKLVPPLLFVVFIENAFKHGVSYRHISFVDIVVKINGDHIRFYCENSVPPITEGRSKSGGIGLENVRKRLDLLYGRTYELTINSKTDIYQVTLTIPAYEDNHTMPCDR